MSQSHVTNQLDSLRGFPRQKPRDYLLVVRVLQLHLTTPMNYPKILPQSHWWNLFGIYCYWVIEKLEFDLVISTTQHIALLASLKGSTGKFDSLHELSEDFALARGWNVFWDLLTLSHGQSSWIKPPAETQMSFWHCLACKYSHRWVPPNPNKQKSKIFCFRHTLN